MPLVRISLRKGRSPEFLRDLSNSVHAALVSQANVPADDQFHIVEELEPHQLVAHKLQQVGLAPALRLEGLPHISQIVGDLLGDRDERLLSVVKG